jgi:hypothetical protein
MDRRSLFFLVGAAAAFALTPVADAAHRWVAIATGVTYIVLAVAMDLDRRSKERRSR